MPSRYRVLTVDEIRARYWDRQRKRGRPIAFASVQTFGDEPKRDLVFDEVFLPDGSLVCETMIGGTAWRPIQRREVLDDWLSESASGPYTGRHSEDSFYYLGGRWLHGNQGPALSSDPLNAISTDCLDEINCWVP